MDLHLEGKVVILTGGFKGIGKGMDALNTRVRDDGDDFDVIDAHFHIWDPAVRRLDWLAGDDGTLNRRWIMDDLAAYYGPFAAQGVRFLGGVRVMGLWGDAAAARGSSGTAICVPLPLFCVHKFARSSFRRALMGAMISGLWFIGLAVLAALTGFAVTRSVHRGRLRPACARPPTRRRCLKYGHSV